ncbi:hypothetical protein [Chamaesiphon sp. OTE_20_metabat_361]|nr:hypothetical protein [Chamaesiphon sp. OTE_20_metabat_361]
MINITLKLHFDTAWSRELSIGIESNIGGKSQVYLTQVATY